MKVPEYFDLKITLKKAIANGAGLVLFLSLIQITNPIALGVGFVFGALGGSANDVWGWLANKDAIIAHNSKKEDSE